MAETSTTNDLLGEARGYLDTRSYDSSERATFRAVVEGLTRIHGTATFVTSQLTRSPLRLPLRLGHDGELLDDIGECLIVVDPNRELPDEVVEAVGSAICAAMNLCSGVAA